jgi:TrmH family RNA methyltransferase
MGDASSRGARLRRGKRLCVPTELSNHNPRIERVRELRTARGRREQGRFAIEGQTLIAEARRSHCPIHELYAVPAALAGHPEIAAFESAHCPIYTLTEKVYARISDLDSPPGLLAILDLPESEPSAILERPGPVLLLAGINDPGNAGTLLRSAEAFGASGALFGRGGADPYAPKVVRAAMGTIFRLPVAAVEAQWLTAAAAAAGRRIVAADLDGDDIRLVDLAASDILAIGNERRGVRDWLEHWDVTVRIPQRGPAQSLNAAVAGSIILYEMSRRS